MLATENSRSLMEQINGEINRGLRLCTGMYRHLQVFPRYNYYSKLIHNQENYLRSAEHFPPDLECRAKRVEMIIEQLETYRSELDYLIQRPKRCRELFPAQFCNQVKAGIMAQIALNYPELLREKTEFIR